jgi:hypothetical protein
MSQTIATVMPAAVDYETTLVLAIEGGVEERRGSLGPAGNAPSPLPARQTGRAQLRHPASRLASSSGTRRWAKVHASQTQYAKLPEHTF